MQSMASACYADDQARSSEGETSSEGTDGTGRAAQGWFQLLWSSIRWPLHSRFTDDFSSPDNHPTVPGTYCLCEAVSTWRSGFRGASLLLHLGRQADCRLWWNQPGARSSEVSNVKSGFHEIR
jgi:hypothetical protein